MQILTVHPAPPGGSTIAHADVEIIDGVKLYGLRISRAEDGTYRAFGQNSQRGRTCSFSREIVAKIAEATISQLSLMSHRTHDRTRD
ncbi:hypothetical protein ACIPUD_26150 [Bradyrhizobium sp. CAR08]